MRVLNETLKIAKQSVKWREASSLIILSKNCIKPKDDTDFKVLLLSRHEKASFFPTTSVFPGGTCEAVDESAQWLEYFQSKGIHENKLENLILKRNPNVQPQPGIFKTHKEDCLHKDLSLRITAIRETFEEMGILLCGDFKSLNENKTGFGFYHEKFDRKHWQHLVHNDASQFLKLCQELDVIPDLRNLNEWSVWLTPADKKKRFEASFYMVTLQDSPSVMLEENEATHYKWLTPKEALISNMKDDNVLAPPQIWELSRLLNFNEMSELQKFAEKRALNGTILMQPSRHKCLDGIVSLLPGDSSYPCDPNAFAELIPVDMTKKEYRDCAEKLHRYEFERPNYGVAHMNFEPIDGHLKPINLC